MRKMKGENRNNEAGETTEHCIRCNAIISVLPNQCTTEEFKAMVPASEESSAQDLCLDCYERDVKEELYDAEETIEELQEKIDCWKDELGEIERERAFALSYQ